MPKSMEERDRREIQRRQAVKDAVNAADKIILNFSNGSNEETDWLTGEVARVFVEKALNPFTRQLFKADMHMKKLEGVLDSLTDIVSNVPKTDSPLCTKCGGKGVFYRGVWHCPICNKEVK
jgi:rubrerythrin